MPAKAPGAAEPKTDRCAGGGWIFSGGSSLVNSCSSRAELDEGGACGLANEKPTSLEAESLVDELDAKLNPGVWAAGAAGFEPPNANPEDTVEALVEGVPKENLKPAGVEASAEEEVSVGFGGGVPKLNPPASWPNLNPPAPGAVLVLLSC